MQRAGVRRRDKRLRRVTAWFCWAAAALLFLPGAFLTGLRLMPWDIGTPWLQLLSLFPASVPLTAVALAAAVLALCLDPRFSRTLLATAVTAVMLLQMGTVAPRILPGTELAAAAPLAAPEAGDAPAARRVTVMALNVGSTGVDAEALLDEVRTRNVDILALPELAPLGLEALDGAGLAGDFPYRALDVDWAGTGSAIFSKFPLAAQERVPGTNFYQTRAVATIPGTTGGVHLTAVHVASPRPGHTPFWRRELRQLGELRLALPGSNPAILLGDFNASQDHREFRDLLATGLIDAAKAAGKGLAPTWPVNAGIPPFVALDHVLVTPNISVGHFAIVRFARTDHSAVVVELRLPG
ncbi:endonuclease/exonuclease/phosphatase family protein [Pseudarthrobacter sp. DSP2-3-2b1]|uniref:endonuclease/exonuclease/phosphatase family protein n=1 Tax=Pseudarthrobacter sp. DSP2-3-2b1 TaxID=2804661 RepID=UPI003CECA86E